MLYGPFTLCEIESENDIASKSVLGFFSVEHSYMKYSFVFPNCERVIHVGRKREATKTWSHCFFRVRCHLWCEPMVILKIHAYVSDKRSPSALFRVNRPLTALEDNSLFISTSVDLHGHWMQIRVFFFLHWQIYMALELNGLSNQPRICSQTANVFGFNNQQ